MLIERQLNSSKNSNGMTSDLAPDTMRVLGATETLSVSIGDIGCSIRSRDAGFLELLRARYRWFESSAPAIYKIQLQVVPHAKLISNDIGKTGQPVVKKINSGADYIIRRGDNPFVAVVNTTSKKVLLRIWHSEYCFDSFLRIFYSLILAQEGGLLLHASSVTAGRQGNVFFGPSGSGKTTVARLSNGRVVLTDELALIKPCNGGYKVYGTPFWGEFTPGRSNASAELTGLYSLKKAQRNNLVPLDKVRAVMALYQCVLFFSDDIPLLSRILDTCCALVDRIPVYELRFRPDPTFWRVLK